VFVLLKARALKIVKTMGSGVKFAVSQIKMFFRCFAIMCLAQLPVTKQ
jgi:hypothetical protein